MTDRISDAIPDPVFMELAFEALLMKVKEAIAAPIIFGSPV